MALPLMSARSRVLLFAAVVFALAMGALEHGGWRWAWLVAGVWVLVLRFRLPLIRVVRRPAIHRYFRHMWREDRKARRWQRRVMRQQRRSRERQT